MQPKNRDSFSISTPRLTLLACEVPLLEALAKGDAAITAYLQINVPPKWSAFGPSIYRYTILQLEDKPSDYIWWTYLVILNESNTLIGAGGFKGAPDENGLVEIGYEIAKPYRQQGFATEMAKGLIGYAFSHAVINTVQAHTYATPNASTRVLRKCGMKKVKEIEMGGEPNIWLWEVKKEISDS